MLGNIDVCPTHQTAGRHTTPSVGQVLERTQRGRCWLLESQLKSRSRPHPRPRSEQTRYPRPTSRSIAAVVDTAAAAAPTTAGAAPIHAAKRQRASGVV